MFPRVSILLPVYNEAEWIDACLESLAAQDYPGEVEIVVADGGSVDGTADRLAEWQTRLGNLVVVPNPMRVQSHGLNLAAEAASGEVLVRADAHSVYAPDYVSASVAALETTGATAVGGNQAAAGRSGFQRAVAEAMRIRLAVGPARFRHADRPTESDTVYLGAFRREDFFRLGGFRTFPSGVAEDADLYFRWRSKGARLVVDPSIRSTYFPRRSPGALWRQYFRYGVGKAEFLQVNGRLPSWRPLAPLLLVAGLAVSPLVGVVTGRWWWAAAVPAVWLGVLAAACRGRPRVVGAAAIMHLAFGLGMIRGFCRRPSRVRAAVVEPAPEGDAAR